MKLETEKYKKGFVAMFCEEFDHVAFIEHLQKSDLSEDDYVGLIDYFTRHYLSQSLKSFYSNADNISAIEEVIIHMDQRKEAVHTYPYKLGAVKAFNTIMNAVKGNLQRKIEELNESRVSESVSSKPLPKMPNKYGHTEAAFIIAFLHLFDKAEGVDNKISKKALADIYAPVFGLESEPLRQKLSDPYDIKPNQLDKLISDAQEFVKYAKKIRGK